MALIKILEDSAEAMRFGGAFVSSCHVAALYGRSRGTLTIHWTINKTFEKVTTGLKDVSCSAAGRPADLLVRLPELDVETLDLQVTEAAWRLGAWDLARFEKIALPAGVDFMQPKWGLVVFFGHNPYSLPGIGALAEGEGASEEDMEKAAKEGWVEWMFKPRTLADPNCLFEKSWRAKDQSLDSQGRRAPRTIRNAMLLRPTEISHCLQYKLGVGG